MRWSDVALPRGIVHVGGGSARNVALTEASCRLVAARPQATGSALLLGQSGHPMTRDSIDAQILCAAHDAGIDGATQITSDCLRHTYLAFLVRQGMRFGDLVQLVGPMPAEMLGMYSALSPPGLKGAARGHQYRAPCDLAFQSRLNSILSGQRRSCFGRGQRLSASACRHRRDCLVGAVVTRPRDPMQ